MSDEEAWKTCPTCGYLNWPRALYCIRCGAALHDIPAGANFEINQNIPPSGEVTPRVCWRCGTHYRSTSTYCSVCWVRRDATTPGTLLEFQGAALTDVGQVRSQNEDSVGLWEQSGLMMAVVADGMGGAAAGEIASSMVIETIRSVLTYDDDLAPLTALPTGDLRDLMF